MSGPRWRANSVFVLIACSTSAGIALAADAPVPVSAGDEPAQMLTREQALEQALAANPAIQALTREVEAARARRLQADGFAPPSFVYDFEEARDSNPSRFGNQKYGIEQTIEWPGRRRLLKQFAALGIEASEAALERTRLRLTAQVRKAFDQVLAAKAALKLIADAAARMQESVDISRGRFRAGTDKYLDVLRTQIEAQRLQNDRRLAAVAVSEAQRNFNALLGESGIRFTAAGELEPAPMNLERDALMADVTETGPSFRLLARRTEQAQTRYEAVRKGRYPDIGVGIQRQRLYGPAAETEYAWAGTLSLSLPLPGTDRQRGLEGEALATAQAAVDRVRAARLSFDARIQQRYDEAVAAAARIESYRASILPDVEDQLKSAQQEYRVRRIDALNLLDAYRTYLAMQRDYLEALASYRAALADLETLGEDLWEVPDVGAVE